jgi:hypothetical protein
MQIFEKNQLETSLLFLSLFLPPSFVSSASRPCAGAARHATEHPYCTLTTKPRAGHAPMRAKPLPASRACPARALHTAGIPGRRIRTAQSASSPPGKPATSAACQSLALAILPTHATILLASHPASARRPRDGASLLPALRCEHC